MFRCLLGANIPLKLSSGARRVSRRLDVMVFDGDVSVCLVSACLSSRWTQTCDLAVPPDAGGSVQPIRACEHAGDGRLLDRGHTPGTAGVSQAQGTEWTLTVLALGPVSLSSCERGDARLAAMRFSATFWLWELREDELQVKGQVDTWGTETQAVTY